MSAAEPARLTPTQRLHEVTMAFAQRSAAPPEHSVTLTRNAKGATQIEVTIRGFDPIEVSARALAIYSGLEIEYPYPSENGSEAAVSPEKPAEDSGKGRSRAEA